VETYSTSLHPSHHFFSSPVFGQITLRHTSTPVALTPLKYPLTLPYGGGCVSERPTGCIHVSGLIVLRRFSDSLLRGFPRVTPPLGIGFFAEYNFFGQRAAWKNGKAGRYEILGELGAAPWVCLPSHRPVIAHRRRQTIRLSEEGTA